LLKAHEFERRLHSVEKVIKDATPETLAMGKNPVILADMENESLVKGR